VADAATAAELAARPLGLADATAFGWRKGAGHPAFRAARRAEDRGDWPAVVAACKQALAQNPNHLEASWLLAVGLAKLGKHGELVAPLQVAEAGDFGKWGPASLELPALQPFLATPAGSAWKKRVEADRTSYLAGLARSLVVASAGDLYAFDPDTLRWLRLTRTNGAVLAGFASAHRIAYVTRTRNRLVGVGTVDLDSGKTTRPIDPGSAAFSVAIGAKPAGFWLGGGAPAAWRQLDDAGALQPLPAKATRPAGPWLEVAGKSVRLHRLPVAGVMADWDDRSLASAMRIGRTGRAVSVPSPGLIDGNTLVWAPDGTHLAFVAQLDDQCKPGTRNAAAFVVDVASGGPRELERASGGLAVEWLADHRLAIAGDRGVSLVDIDTGARTPVDNASGLAVPRRRPRCTAPEPDDPEPTDEPE
jgi:hypothetical protein